MVDAALLEQTQCHGANGEFLVFHSLIRAPQLLLNLVEVLLGESIPG